MQVSVLLAGMLTGMGRTTQCEIIAKRQRIEGGGFDYSEIKMLHAPADFPSGDYTLKFNDVSLPVTYRQKQWTILPAMAAEASAARVEAVKTEAAAAQGPLKQRRVAGK